MAKRGVKRYDITLCFVSNKESFVERTPQGLANPYSNYQKSDENACRQRVYGPENEVSSLERYLYEYFDKDTVDAEPDEETAEDEQLASLQVMAKRDDRGYKQSRNARYRESE